MTKNNVCTEGRWEERPVRFWWEAFIYFLVIAFSICFIFSWTINDWNDKLIILIIGTLVGLLVGAGAGFLDPDGRPKKWVWVRKER